MTEEEYDFYVNGIAATTAPTLVNGRRIVLTVEALERLAEQAPLKPLLYEHKGRPIGRILKAWVAGDKLHYRAGLYKPKDDWTRKGIEAIKSGRVKGISISFAFSEDDVSAVASQ